MRASSEASMLWCHTWATSMIEHSGITHMMETDRQAGSIRLSCTRSSAWRHSTSNLRICRIHWRSLIKRLRKESLFVIRLIDLSALSASTSSQMLLQLPVMAPMERLLMATSQQPVPLRVKSTLHLRTLMESTKRISTSTSDQRKTIRDRESISHLHLT